jgi:hypothetical protein
MQQGRYKTGTLAIIVIEKLARTVQVVVVPKTIASRHGKD